MAPPLHPTVAPLIHADTSSHADSAGELHPIFTMKPAELNKLVKKTEPPKKRNRQPKEDESDSFSEFFDSLSEEDFEEDEVEYSDVDDFLMANDEAFQNSSDPVSQWMNRRRKKKKRERTLFAKTKRRKRKTAATESKASPEVEEIIRNANSAYLERNISLAVSLAEEAIRMAPGLHDPFHLLGLIYEEEFCDRPKALDCYFIAAHLVPDDAHLWKRVAGLAQELGNLKQAIYCYRKCVAASGSESDMDDSAVFDLAGCYIANKEYNRALPRLQTLFHRHPNDPFLGRELAKCYHQQGDIEAAIVTLESCVSVCLALEDWKLCSAAQQQSLLIKQISDESTVTAFDPHATNMLAEVLIESGKFKTCQELLEGLLPCETLERSPIDLVVKLAAAQTYLGLKETKVITHALSTLLHLDMSRRAFHDLFLLLGEAFFSQGDAAVAFRLFSEVASVPEVRADATIWVKIARCQLQLEGRNDSSASLEKCIYEKDSTARGSIGRHGKSEARLMLSQVLSKLGKAPQLGNIVLSMPSADAAADKSILPDAIPTSERRSMLLSLQAELPDLLPLCSKQSADISADERKRQEEWVSRFLKLLGDSEFDSRRVLRWNFERRLEKVQLDHESQHALLKELGLETDTIGTEEGSGDVEMANHEITDSKNKKDSKQKRPTGLHTSCHSIHYARVKQELGLVSVEDILGWKDFGFFLETGIGVIMKSLGMFRAAVELIEAILATKRTVRAQQYDLDRRVCLQSLKKLSLQLSIEGGLYRVALAYIREKYLRRPDSSDRALQTFGRLLFCGAFAHSTMGSVSASVEKDALLENRAWCVRQLLQRPRSFMLTLLTGHFCSISGRWPLAVAEYSRAHRLRHKDDLTSLCLATSFLNFATSRSVQDRHAAVLRGFSMLTTYANQRRKTSLKTQRSLSLALREQHVDPLLSASILAAINDVFEAEILFNMARSFHQLNLLHSAVPLYTQSLQRLPSPYLTNKLPELPSSRQLVLLSIDAQQVRFCAAHNLSLIQKEKGCYEEATSLTDSCIVWGD